MTYSNVDPQTTRAAILNGNVDGIGPLHMGVTMERSSSCLSTHRLARSYRS